MEYKPDINALALRWYFQQDDYAMDLVKGALLPKINNLARNLFRKCKGYVEQDDLIACGLVGLTKSLKGFAPESGDYEPYAMQYVRGEMLHWIRDHSLPIKIPGSVKETGIRIARFTNEFTERNGRAPDVKEVADGLNLSTTRIEHCINIAARKKTTEPLESWEDTPVDIHGRSAGPEVESGYAALYYEIMEMRRENPDESGAYKIKDKYGLSYDKIRLLLEHIDADLGIAEPDPTIQNSKIKPTADSVSSLFAGIEF